MLQTGASAGWPAVLERIIVARGYEAALGAALGDDLDASDDDDAPTHWALSQSSGDPALPAGARPLTAWVEAPPALHRRLAQIGLVARDMGPSLRQHLKAGQRLVSIEGDLWRWDGFTQAAEAPSPAARRLTEKNRLEELIIEAAQARAAVEEAEARMEAAQAAVTEASDADQRARQAARLTHKTLAEARNRPTPPKGGRRSSCRASPISTTSANARENCGMKPASACSRRARRSTKSPSPRL